MNNKDRTEYSFIYKCRLCGCLDSSTRTGDRDNVFTVLDEVISKDVCNKFGIPVCRESIHFCNDGSIGISDLQGARYEE